jgi:phosphate uptake regulator
MSIALEAKVAELERRIAETEQALDAAIDRILALEQPVEYIGDPLTSIIRRKPGPKPKDSNG